MLVKKQERRSSSNELINIIKIIEGMKEEIKITINVTYKANKLIELISIIL
jgi:hypothetical protein